MATIRNVMLGIVYTYEFISPGPKDKIQHNDYEHKLSYMRLSENSTNRTSFVDPKNKRLHLYIIIDPIIQ